MHVLVVGGRGQLGSALCTLFDRQSVRLTMWDRPEYDITRPDITSTLIDLQPDLVVNCAAWTNVDAAENAPDEVYAVNALGPKYLADGCRALDALLVQISTNEVFRGDTGQIYREYDQPAPISVYARSKCAGERAVAAHHHRWMIVRVAWLFGPGGQNFPSKIVAAADRHGSLRLVADEFSNPTYALDAAEAIAALAAADRPGIYHIVNDGYASRYEFAEQVLQSSGRGHTVLTPITADEWPRPTQPPRHAVLVNQTAAALDIRLRHWREAVADYAATLTQVQG